MVASLTGGAWIEMDSISPKRRPKRVASLTGGAWIEMSTNLNGMTVNRVASLTGGAWIEMQQCLLCTYRIPVASLMDGAWIEIFLWLNDRRWGYTSHRSWAVRGLKSKSFFCKCRPFQVASLTLQG